LFNFNGSSFDHIKKFIWLFLFIFDYVWLFFMIFNYF
jgi:hypothetical protein